MGIPHVVAIPSPIQGSIIPMLELLQNIAKFGFKVTFVNTELNHQKIINALPQEDDVKKIINFVTIPDGLEEGADRRDWKKSSVAMQRVMPLKLRELIEKINLSDDDKVTCVISDETIGWSPQIPKEMNIKQVVFWPCSIATQAFMFSIQKMIDDGIIDNKGRTLKDQMIQLSPSMPEIRTTDLPWATYGNPIIQEMVFHIFCQNNKSAQAADKIICNSFYELDPAPFSLFPNMIPIGPLLANNRLGKSKGYFLQEDSSCLKWLDQQPANSVIYVSFGSSTVFDISQFKELALGLELVDRPFLWVMRPDLPNQVDEGFLEGFKERVGIRGKIVDWAPQQAVLSHPSVACFLSHCGWNSSLEGISNGVPFLCWPYYGDQVLNQVYITDVWKVGVRFDRHEKQIVRQQEIKAKVEKLLSDPSFKEKALQLKEMALNSVKEGGDSHKNFSDFIEWMKESTKTHSY